jgi:hypothetical protein
MHHCCLQALLAAAAGVLRQLLALLPAYMQGS